MNLLARYQYWIDNLKLLSLDFDKQFNRFYKYFATKQEENLSIQQFQKTFIRLLMKNQRLKDGIVYVDLSEMKFTDKIFKQLRELSWKNIIRIEADNNLLTTESIRLLLSFDLRVLYELSLNSNKFNSQSIIQLRRGNWPELNTLQLRKNSIQNKGLEALVSNQTWRQLQVLRLDQIQLVNTKIPCIRKGVWDKMRFLSLSNNILSRKEIKFLVKADFKEMKTLKLYKCKIDDEGVIQLSKGSWKKLQTVCLELNPVSNRGLKTLRSANWKKIFYVTFSRTQYSLQTMNLLAYSNWGHDSYQKLWIDTLPGDNYTFLDKQILKQRYKQNN